MTESEARAYFDMTEQEQDSVFRWQRWQIIIGFAAVVALVVVIVSHI